MGFRFEGERTEQKREGRERHKNEITRERKKKNQPIKSTIMVVMGMVVVDTGGGCC